MLIAQLESFIEYTYVFLCDSECSVLFRVSFGSSKGSMVETLIFETPTPLPEHAEREFFPVSNQPTNEDGINDSCVELQEE